nr:site-specific integrase [Sphingomicrobium astaxanthinifaciens]
MAGGLTALKAKSLKKAGRYTDGRGLMLYVKASGSKSWVLRLTIDGKRRDIGLGSFDDVSLADARAKADELRLLVKSGVDPTRLDDPGKAGAAMTFREAAKAVHEERKDGWKNPKHAAQWLSSLEEYANPYIGEKLVADIDGPSIRDLLAEIWLSKPETARRVRQRIGTVLDWAYARGLRNSEAPLRSISRGLPRQPKKDSHFAALPYVELPTLICQLSERSTVGRRALQFLILTAARSGEVRGATWREIDLERGQWNIPGDRMKMGKDHKVPLTPASTKILIEMAEAGTPAEGIIFPGQRGRPMSDMTLMKVLRTALPGSHTVHGLRSSFRDWAAEQTDYPGEVVEAALAHAVQNRVEAAYRRTDFFDKRKRLMEEWASFLYRSDYKAGP